MVHRSMPHSYHLTPPHPRQETESHLDHPNHRCFYNHNYNHNHNHYNHNHKHNHDHSKVQVNQTESALLKMTPNDNMECF